MTDKNIFEEKPYAPLAELSRMIAAQGCVLLKNENNILPLDNGKTVSFFGRTQIDYNKSGTGSGGLVNTEYEVNIIDGVLTNEKIKVNKELLEVYKEWIKENPFDKGSGWATEPWCQKEMVPSQRVVEAAREKSDTAVIIIGRTAGEDRDNAPEKGSWFLTDEEEALFDIVSKYFENTVAVLNVGNIIDMNWVEKYNIKSVLYVWQGGQEGGNAVADVLSGDVNPCGKLSDTIARDISDYPCNHDFGGTEYNLYREDIYVGYRYFETFAPEKVLYPFGFGLSYTSFDITTKKIFEHNGVISAEIEVTNTGKKSGREVVEVYFGAPQGKLGKSVRELCAFAKTHELEPSESETIMLDINIADMSSYDDSGITGHKSCYVLEPGEYNIYIGKCVRCAEKVFSFSINDLTVIKTLSEALAPERDFDVMYPVLKNDEFVPAYRKVSTRTVDYDMRIKENLPPTIPYTGDKGIKLTDVKAGRERMEDFVAQLSDDDLRCMIIGEGMSSPKVRPGSTGAFGGVTPSLAAFGIPVVCVCDGPSGVRMDNGDAATSLPNGTLIACTWDVAAAEKLYEYVSVELSSHNIDSLLGPGINIHRSPLNGRNFEYMSEDPLLTGKIGAALVRGINVHNNAATVKHFAANSQEFHRSEVVSVISERALREIYLKGFETVVKEGGVKSIMTSYNPLNERWTAINYELNSVILREEWGYKGFVMTDWWPRLSKTESEKINLREVAESQNDVYMLASNSAALNTNIPDALEDGSLTRGQLQRNVMNLLRYIMTTNTFDRFTANGGTIVNSLRDDIDNLNVVFEHGSVGNNETVSIKYNKTGKHLLCIDYTADAPELSQLVISANINGTPIPTVTVSGTNGGECRAYMDYTTRIADGTVTFTFPSAVKIKKFVIMG